MALSQKDIERFNETVALMETCILEACVQFNVAPPKVRFSNRMTRATGSASKTTISFSIPLLIRADRADSIETAVHETAHYIDFQQRGTSDHGEIWRNLMKQLGYPDAKRCHQIDRDELYRYEVVCAQCHKTLRKYTRRPTTLHKYRSNCCNARLKIMLL